MHLADGSLIVLPASDGSVLAEDSPVFTERTWLLFSLVRSLAPPLTLMHAGGSGRRAGAIYPALALSQTSSHGTSHAVGNESGRRVRCRSKEESNYASAGSMHVDRDDT